MDYGNEWQKLTNTVIQRVKKALLTPAFIFNFIGVIVICGSMGVWLPYYMNISKTMFRPEAFFTYGISILATVIAEMFLREDDENPKSLKMLFLLIIAISITCLFLDLIRNLKVTWLGITGVSFVLMTWFILNANDDKYDDKQSPNNSLGGNMTSPMDLPGAGLK